MVVAEKNEGGNVIDRASYVVTPLGRNFYADCEEAFARKEVVLCHGEYYWSSDFDVLSDNLKEIRDRNDDYIKNVWKDPE